jgi:hypothetical protein
VATEVLIVIPTLGQRVDYLRQTLESIRNQQVAADITVVTPVSAVAARSLAHEFNAKVIDDPGSLPAAINLGVADAGMQHLYVNWLGDDDLLTADSLRVCVATLVAHPKTVLAYGACEYIDEQGQTLWVSRAGKWAQRILSWGPDLIPQPGMLVRRAAWSAVGGLDTSLRFAFDLDLLLKLRRQGRFVDVGAVVSQFRWHPDSLTVSDRTSSLNESEEIKRRYLSPWARKLSWLWEKPVRGATRVAARSVTRRAIRAANAR